MDSRKKAVILLSIIIIIAIIATCISRFGTKKESVTQQTANKKAETTVEPLKNEEEHEEKKEHTNTSDIKDDESQNSTNDNKPKSFDSVKMLHANEDHSYISSDDLYNNIDKLIGYNFLTTAKIDKLTSDIASLILKENEPSIVFNTVEDYTDLIKNGDEVAVIGTIYEYEEVDNKKLVTAWVSFLAAGEDNVKEYKKDITDPIFTDLLE